MDGSRANVLKSEGRDGLVHRYVSFLRLETARAKLENLYDVKSVVYNDDLSQFIQHFTV